MAHLLLINCPDEKGLIAKITGTLYSHGLNIVNNGEFVEKKTNHFFMRTEFSGAFDSEVLLENLRQVLPANVNIKLTSSRKKNIIVLATKEHHCLSDLLIRCTFNELHANISSVISNYQNLEELTQKFNVPFHYINHEGKDRKEYENEILMLAKSYEPEFIVLAKYMRILSPTFISEFPNKIINIHHSFLPAFIGANPYAQAYARGVKIIGATAHFVNDDLDEGPILAQNVIPTSHSQSAKEMAQAGRDVEKIVLATALRLVLEEKVFVHQNKTIIFD
jgi:formyltetrahydrofolate deformylase